MAWDVEVTGEFKDWWSGLTEAECISVERAVLPLEERGPHLPFPAARYMARAIPLCVNCVCNTRDTPTGCFTFFDPRRVALLLLGGDKTGDDRWYEKNVPLADQIYDNYLAEIEEEDNAKDDKVQ